MGVKRRFLCLGRRNFIVLLSCSLALILLTLYNRGDYDTVQYVKFRYSNSSAELVDGYLVWNPKCHMQSKDPFDPSIREFVWKEEYRNCSSIPPLTSIARTRNGTFFLKIDPDVLKRHYGSISCCWAPVTRPVRTDDLDIKYDSEISTGDCNDFEDSVAVPRDVEIVHVSCRDGNSSYLQKLVTGFDYENVHAIIQSAKVSVKSQRNAKRKRRSGKRKLSVLMLGIDNVSRLNFYRSMPLTKKYLDERNWFELKGYNKMGDNTFPNVMAILTGQSERESFDRCKPSVPFGLDNCPFVWNDFKKAGYVTAYGEDNARLNTFNFLKVGFVKPPTDYYMRPYVLAYEYLIQGQHRFFAKYCAGPELAFDRIFDYAVDFAKTFVGRPYFGLFWTSSVSHENVNGPTVVDADFRAKLEKMEASGVFNDSMVVFLSDHGMRYGGIRSSYLGWYEERLPFIYVWLPEWFRRRNPDATEALRINRNRLTSPYDLYETLRDVLGRAGGKAKPSSGCPTCRSLLKPVPRVRGCSDAGISRHWCTCDAFQLASATDEIVTEGANRFVEFAENMVKGYRDEAGARLCARPKLARISKVEQVVDLDHGTAGGVLELFYSLELDPGDCKFEVTVRYLGPGNYSVKDEEVSRLDSYEEKAKCLNAGPKKYCYCELPSR